MPRVFLSRALRTDGPFLPLQQQSGWDLVAISLLQFEAVPIGILPVADWLFFYSRKGVAFFLEQTKPPASLKLAALGPGTAAQLSASGYEAEFIGNGSPAAVAEAFLKVAARKKVLFVQARHSRKSIQNSLGQQVKGIDIVVYDNAPCPVVVEPVADYLIFTSPLNFETYQQCNRILPQQRLIGIGPTTEKAFQLAGIINYRIASQPTEAALLSCLLKWEKEQAY